jgi:hypothetical protein
MSMTQQTYTPGMKVRVHQQIPRQNGAWTTSVEGIVQRYGQQKTGSWFAHSKDDKLWIDRLEIVKADGEIVVCNLNQLSRVEIISRVSDSE